MPNKAAMILDLLGVTANKRDWESARVGANKDYGTPLIPLGEKREGVLFPSIPYD
jgi:methionyl-tRNA synthetase